MAILDKIRQKTFFLVLIIGLALFAFVLSGIFGNGTGNTGPTEPIGVINDEEISIQDFRYFVDLAERQQGYTTIEAVNTVWEQYVQNIIFKTEFKTLGIDAGKEQIEQAVSSTESINTNPQFINEAGFFDFELFTNFIFQMRNENPQAYEQWKSQEAQIISSARELIYFDLIQSSINITPKEAKILYHLESDNLNLDYVQIPFETISDSVVKVTDSEIKSYIEEHASSYQREAERGIEYVAFFENATQEDQTTIRTNLEALLEDQIEYNNVSKLTDTIQGFKSIDKSNIRDFVEKYSEEGFDSVYLPKGKISNGFAEILYNLKPGEVFGPYKDINSFKISRVLDRKKNGYIRASQILISHEETIKTNESNRLIIRTKEAAKEIAYKYLRQIRKDPSKFETLASENSDVFEGRASGDLGFFQEGEIIPEIFEFANKSSVGTVGVIETDYGFHIIKITDKEDIVLFADVTHKIVPSSKTANDVFKNATQFEMTVTKGSDFAQTSKSNGYDLRRVSSIDILAENLPGLGNQRFIVQWLFEENTEIGNIKRFNLSSGGYVIVRLTDKKEKGLMSVDEVRNEVTEILKKQKKADIIIKDNFDIDSLESLAANNNVEITSALAINQKNKTLVGAGSEPKVIGAAFSLDVDKTSDFIVGEKGVYKLRVVAKKISEDLEDYTLYAKSLTRLEREKTDKLILGALESAADIIDNRALYY